MVGFHYLDPDPVREPVDVPDVDLTDCLACDSRGWLASPGGYDTRCPWCAPDFRVDS